MRQSVCNHGRLVLSISLSQLRPLLILLYIVTVRSSSLLRAASYAYVILRH